VVWWWGVHASHHIHPYHQKGTGLIFPDQDVDTEWWHKPSRGRWRGLRSFPQDSRNSVIRQHCWPKFSIVKGKMSALWDLGNVLTKLYEEYNTKTPKRLKIVDGYLLYILLTGVIQFLYCCLVGTFPFNSFLSGFISSVGSFILAVCLRIQTNPRNKKEFSGLSPERAFADFIFAHVILHLVVMNFIGWNQWQNET